MHFVTRPEQGREMEAVVLHRVGFLAYSCPKEGQDFKPSSSPVPKSRATNTKASVNTNTNRVRDIYMTFWL